ncbi:Chromate transporter [Macrophomina phaseolina MS6]|uniref:Chromate transporter n=1 Tax=Macrophomina phaseolina (strain MS6) TaxID=1126212 RepID=K2S4M8_MACPH|nr:Chromate transporter [Macrophomina phaseolina MS6]
MQLPASLSRHLSALRALAHQAREQSTSPHGNHKTLPNRLADVLVRTWDLGFTSFGGPAVHFQILHQRFVAGRGGKQKWADEQTYQELFAICQGLPGPGSTKMIFCLALLHAGFIPALLVFLIWSLPGAVGMYALSLGVQRINETMPAPVYALLSGLNASTVGIIALAAVQLAEKAIRDKLTRILIILGACAGLCYNALWYFPLLMLLGGLATVVWDSWMSQKINRVRVKLKRRKENREGVAEETGAVESLPLEERITSQNGVQRRSATAGTSKSGHSVEALPHGTVGSVRPQPATVANPSDHAIRVKVGIAIALVFFASFIGILVARGLVEAPPLALDLFANMYLAGTVIFGGGPVVIPLLRSYVVDPGWVSSRDFLLGLAIIQAFPGPNFNFAVYLGALALQRSQFPTVLGALLGFLGIFFPGITLAVAVQSFWRVLRTKKWVVDLLRGVNAAAVGLVFTAVYRLWEIGYLTSKVSQGQSLALEPWWVVVAAVTYAESAWFNVPPALAIVIGAVLGLCWYGAVGR